VPTDGEARCALQVVVVVVVNAGTYDTENYRYIPNRNAEVSLGFIVGAVPQLWGFVLSCARRTDRPPARTSLPPPLHARSLVSRAAHMQVAALDTR
jgi:hypothetical protein